MGRKKVFPAGDAVNPLQRMFGAYLRLERTALGYSSLEVASRLGITDTYLRLAESGRTALNQSLAFKLIEVLADTTAPTHESRTISFSRLALFMVGMHWVGAEMTLYNGADAGRRATEALASRVSDFQIFFERVRRYFELSEGENDQKSFVEKEAVAEVRLFLTSETYALAAEKSIGPEVWRLGDLRNIPTLNLEILLDLKQALSGRSFVHTADIASKWEMQRASQFSWVRGVYKSSSLIVNEENLKRFHYEYLSEKRFEGIQMIFLNCDKHVVALKKEFVRLLNLGRMNRSPALPQLEKDEIDKIRFLCPSAQACKEYETELNQMRRRGSNSDSDPIVHDAYWSFQTHVNLHIGFVGLSKGNADNIRNLTLEDAMSSFQTFKKVWDGLNAAHAG